MGKAPEEDVVAAINTGIAWATTGTNLFYGPVRPAGDEYPSRCIFVVPTGGAAPEAFLGQSYAYRRSALQIRTRGDRQDYNAALADARAIRDVVHYAVLSGYVDCRVQNTEPIPLGTDEAGHHEFSINVITEFRE